MLIDANDLTIDTLLVYRAKLQDMKLKPGQVMYVDSPEDIGYIIPDYGNDNEEYW